MAINLLQVGSYLAFNSPIVMTQVIKYAFKNPFHHERAKDLFLSVFWLSFMLFLHHLHALHGNKSSA